MFCVVAVAQTIHGRKIFHTWIEAEKLLHKKKVDITPIISHEFPRKLLFSLDLRLVRLRGVPVLCSVRVLLRLARCCPPCVRTVCLHAAVCALQLLSRVPRPAPFCIVSLFAVDKYNEAHAALIKGEGCKILLKPN